MIIRGGEIVSTTRHDSTTDVRLVVPAGRGKLCVLGLGLHFAEPGSWVLTPTKRSKTPGFLH